MIWRIIRDHLLELVVVYYSRLSSGELSSFENGNYELLFEKTKLDVHVIIQYSEKNILSLLLLSLRNSRLIHSI